MKLISLISILYYGSVASLNDFFFDLHFTQLHSRQLDSNDLCSQQFNYFLSSLRQNDRWAQQMLDSWGRVPSGIFAGNLFDFGNFDQCINLQHHSSVGNIDGQYCTLMVPLDLINSDEQSSKFMPPSRSSSVNLGIGICMPASCTPDQIKGIVDEFASNLLNITDLPSLNHNLCTTKHRPYASSTSLLISATVFFSGILILVALSTAYDIVCIIRKVDKRLVLCTFSCYSNCKAIFTTKTSKAKEIVFIHGIRSLSMIWIVIGHTYLITFWLAPSLNSHSMIEWIGDLTSMVVHVGFLGVDTFFLLSSLLLTLSVFRELDKTNKINVPLLYVKRYFRVTIPLAALVLFILTFFYHISDGPLWNMTVNGAVIQFCNDWWWSTLLYVGNYVNPGKICVGHSWYLMVDMQLYFLSPILLYPLWRFRKRTLLMIFLIFVIASSSVIFVFVIFMMKGFRVNYLSELNFDKDKLVYTKTHGRIDSWMMGILVGFILYKIEGKPIKISRAVLTIGWTLSMAAMLAVTFGQYPLHQENFEENHLAADATYDSLKRISWCMAVGWIIIACRMSHGGIFQWFLSLPVWIPISKLSFSIYLIHVPIQLIYFASIRSPQFFSNLRAVYKFFGDFGVSFFAALVFALMFEYPTLNIIALLTTKRKSVA